MPSDSVSSSQSSSSSGVDPNRLSQYLNAYPAFNVGNVPNVGELYGSVMKELQGWGNQEQQDLKQNYLNAMGLAQQQLSSAGLSGTTIAPSMRMGYMRQYEQSLNRLNQQIVSTQVGYQTQLGLAGNQMNLQAQEAERSQAIQYGQQSKSSSTSVSANDSYNSDPFGLFS